MKKRILALVLCVAMCLSMGSMFAGCDSKQDVDAFVIMTEQLDGLFNPFFSTSANDGTIVAMTQIGMLSSKFVNREVEVGYGDNEAVVVKDYDIVEYPYTENMLLYLISRNYITDKKVTQASLEGLIEKVFERYHFTSSQGNISKALAELKKPFYYGTRDTLYTVVREGRRYLIKKHLAGLRANANEFARKYQKHLLFPTPFPLAASIYQEKKKQEEFVDVFIFRVDSDYAHAMKNDMFDLFDRNAFFNIIAYDDNVIVLLNRDYPHVLKLSKTIETLFSVTSPDATDQSTFTPEYIETDEDNVSSAD